MLGDLITRCLVMVLGYAYPAFECYRTVERHRVENQEFRFWCQYWIIVAIVTVLERFADAFISWLPMYGELKLALFIYLWHPKTKGTFYVYEKFLRPVVSRNEPDIDRKLLEWRARAWDLAVFYWQNCTELGQTTFLQVLEYVAGQSRRFRGSRTERNNRDSGPYPPPPPSSHGAGRKRDSQSGKNKKWSPTPSAPPFPGNIINRIMAAPPKSSAVLSEIDDQGEYAYPSEMSDLDQDSLAYTETNLEKKRQHGHLFRRAPKPEH